MPLGGKVGAGSQRRQVGEACQLLKVLATVAAKALAAGGAALFVSLRAAPPALVGSQEAGQGPPDAGKILDLAAAHGIPDQLLAEKVLSLRDNPVDGEALRTGIAVIEDATCDPRGGMLPQGFLADLCVRVGPAAQPFGTLHVYSSHPRLFTHVEIELCSALADLGAAIIKKIRRLSDLEKAEGTRAQLMRVTTHELRSPITVAQSLLRNVLRGYAGQVIDQQRYVFERIASQLELLANLVNDILDLAASKGPGMVAEEGPVVVNASVGRAVLALQPRAEEKGIALTLRPCQEELVVWATEDALDHIFNNLVDNAVKYTPLGGSVSVSLARTDGEAQVTVADSGIGIPQEAMAHLFEEFYRAPNARAFNAAGTGLGLAIVRELADRYKGRVAVESVAGRGTVFTVSFPLYHAS